MGRVALELLSELVDARAAGLELYARQWCDTAEDVVQDAFLKLMRQDPSPANPPAWLYRVVRNGAISAARAAGRRRRHEATAAATARSWFEPQPGEAIDGETATEALEQLPVEQRETIVAHLWGGLTFDEIAAVSECSASTAHRRYLAGLAALREKLGVTCPTKSENKS